MRLGGMPYGPAGTGKRPAPGETGVLLHPPLPSVGESIGMERGRQQNDRISRSPAIGKTETVKALGSQLGRYVLVFCCDENFDMHAMGRIFIGLCQVGAWGCFDEFNRLAERELSACSQQIQTIQEVRSPCPNHLGCCVGVF